MGEREFDLGGDGGRVDGVEYEVVGDGGYVLGMFVVGGLGGEVEDGGDGVGGGERVCEVGDGGERSEGKKGFGKGGRGE